MFEFLEHVAVDEDLRRASTDADKKLSDFQVEMGTKHSAKSCDFRYWTAVKRAISQPELLAGESPLPKFVADYDTSFKECRVSGQGTSEVQAERCRTKSSRQPVLQLWLSTVCMTGVGIQASMAKKDIYDILHNFFIRSFTQIQLRYQIEKLAERRTELETTKIDKETDKEQAAFQNEELEDADKIEGSVAGSFGTYTTFPDNVSKIPSTTDISRRDTRDSSMSKFGSSMKSTRRGRKQGRGKKRKDPEREKQIQEFLGQPPQIIPRRKSYEELRSYEPDTRVMLARCQSLPEKLDFYGTIEKHYTGTEDGIFRWTKDEFWYKWFDELYPPSEKDGDEDNLAQSHSSEATPSIVENILNEIKVIHPPVTNENRELYEALQSEIDSLTLRIEGTQSTETLAFHLCRRGACHRKLGQLKDAWDDLQRAIELEPQLLDAYWHRHLLYLLQENIKKALDDLNYILKHNPKNARAFRSRADIYRRKNDVTMAIVNYSQAIKLDPNNPDIYYERASMFEERDDVLLALEDYKIAHNLMPSRTEAINNIGIYHFENKLWSFAAHDFTELLKQEPANSVAYTYRGRAYAKLAQYPNAVRDFSLAIHLDPNNALAYYHRGCLLRKASPRRALQDLSFSILLDDTVANVNAYLHRGILYTDMKRWEEAVNDFESALELNINIPAAHVNLGLIHLTKFNNPPMAVRLLDAAIKVDPTYVRAYICRAEAKQKMMNFKSAVLDYTRAIHIQPDNTDYRMARGELLLKRRQFDLASFHIKQCASMNQGTNASATQQSAVQAFLKNYHEAIEILERAVKSKPLPSLYILLGKTKMKAKHYKDSVETFAKALELMKPWDSKDDWPIQAAQVYYHIGIAFKEMVNLTMALEAFNNAIKVDPEYAEAYYQRGLAKMKLRHTKGIQDFNRALAYNPRLFQAFLSRAAYYGMKGRHAKAIMNCNEAIRLQSKSVRAYLYRGALKYHIRAFGFAVKDLTKAISIDQSCVLAYFNRAVCYQEMRYFQKALKDYGIVLLLEKKENIKVLQNRGLLYLETGDIHNALQDFQAAAVIEPRNQKIHHTLGICYHRLGRLNDAFGCYSNALDIDPFFVDALLGRGNAWMDFGGEHGIVFGKRDYLRALHFNPMCLPARVNLAYNLQAQGKFKASWIQFTQSIELDEDCKPAYEGRAIVNLQMGNTFGAFMDINRALKIEETAELFTNRGVISQFMGDHVNAMRDYQKAVRQDPSYSLAYYNAANLYFQQRQFRQALDYYDKAIGWDQEDESAILNRAITKVMMKNVKGALEDFSRAAELSPYSAHIYFNRGNLYASVGKLEDAENDYTTALHLQPGDALVYKRRADVRGKLSRRKEALEDYRKAVLIQTQKTQRG